MRHQVHPTKFPLFQYIQVYRPFADPVPHNTKQYQLILTKYQPALSYILTENHQVPLIIRHLVRHSSANWTISLLWLIRWVTHSILGQVFISVYLCCRPNVKKNEWLRRRPKEWVLIPTRRPSLSSLEWGCWVRKRARTWPDLTQKGVTDIAYAKLK